MAEQLRTALNEGRLDLNEFDERVRQAYSARTYGELDGILDDLPGVVPVAASQVVPAQPGQPYAAAPAHPGGRVPHWLLAVWGSWLTTTLIVLVIWAATGAGPFWPIWVFGPWGAILLVRTLGGLASGTDPAVADRERRRAERDRRRTGRFDRD